MLGVLPLIAGLVLLSVAAGDAPPRLPEGWSGWGWMGTILGTSAGVWFVVGLLVSRLLRDRSPETLHRAELAGVSAAFGCFVAWVLLAGWATRAPGLFLGILPLAALFCWWWAVLLRASGAPNWPAAFAALGLRVRLGLLPLLTLIGLMDLLRLAITAGPVGGEIAIIALLLSPIIVLILAPAVLALLWQVRDLAPGPARTAAEEACRSLGVRVSRIVVWQRGRTPFFNAAVLGLAPKPRHLVLSQDLVDTLPPDELLAVIGHELGHIRHHHLLLQLLFLMTASTWAATVALPLSQMAAAVPGLDSLGPGSREGLVFAALILVLLRFVFAPLSRACERQADLAGASLAGIDTMQSALLRIAHLAGIEPEAPEWRHGSIASRIRWLEELRLDPERGSWHHRHIMRWRGFILVLLVAAVLASQLSGPMGQPDLERLRKGDPQLAQALDEVVDQGQSGSLQRWLQTAPPPQRQQLAVALLNWFETQATGENLRELGNQRRWLDPFARIRSGNDRLDLELDNLSAYLTVASGSEPSPDDLVAATAAIERLRSALVQQPHQHHWLDTIGCVLFALGQRSEAAEAFAQALSQLEAAKRLSPAVKSWLTDLYRRRLEAARSPDAPMVQEWDLPPLPVVP